MRELSVLLPISHLSTASPQGSTPIAPGSCQRNHQWVAQPLPWAFFISHLNHTYHQHQHCCFCFCIFSSLSATLLVFLYFLAMPQALWKLIFLYLAIKCGTTSQLQTYTVLSSFIHVCSFRDSLYLWPCTFVSQTLPLHPGPTYLIAF